MPKIIDKVRERAVAEARSVLLRDGYNALTIRQIAGKLNIAPGTFYNYFPSKEYLAACVMLEDWQQLTRDFENRPAGRTPEEVFAGLFDLVRGFTLRYIPAWKEYEQHGSSQSMLRRYHGSLVRQIAAYLESAIPRGQREKEPWLAETSAEMILRFGSDIDVPYETIRPAVLKLLRNG